MPSFLLENIDGNDVTNENHEAFEQFVVCWLFNEIIPRTCRVPGKVDAKGKCVSVDETKPSIRVLELGGVHRCRIDHDPAEPVDGRPRRAACGRGAQCVVV